MIVWNWNFEFGFDFLSSDFRHKNVSKNEVFGNRTEIACLKSILARISDTVLLTFLSDILTFFAWYSERPNSERPKSELRRNPNFDQFGFQSEIRAINLNGILHTFGLVQLRSV